MNETKILIVDDVALMRKLLMAVLKPFGYNSFDQCADGAEAIERYRQTRHDLVFLDIDMPGKDGFQCLQEILAINADAYVVMVSAHNDVELVGKAVGLGAKGYVVKNYTPGNVAGMMKKFQESLSHRP